MTTKKFVIVSAACLSALFVLTIFLAITFGPKQEKLKIKIEAEPLKYKIIEKTSESCWVVVETLNLPSESKLKATVFEIWQNEEKENIFLYLPEMDTDLIAYVSAKFEDGDLEEFKINPSSLEGTKFEGS